MLLHAQLGIKCISHNVTGSIGTNHFLPVNTNCGWKGKGSSWLGFPLVEVQFMWPQLLKMIDVNDVKFTCLNSKDIMAHVSIQIFNRWHCMNFFSVFYSQLKFKSLSRRKCSYDFKYVVSKTHISHRYFNYSLHQNRITQNLMLQDFFDYNISILVQAMPLCRQALWLWTRHHRMKKNGRWDVFALYLGENWLCYYGTTHYHVIYVLKFS